MWSVQSTVSLFFWIFPTMFKCSVWSWDTMPRTSCSLSGPQICAVEAFAVKTAGSWSILLQKLTQLVGCRRFKTHLQTHAWAISSRPSCSSLVSDVFLVAVDSYFLVSSQTNLFALLSWELHLLDSTFIMFAGQAVLLSLAGESKIFFKCLNRWLPRSLEVKIKTCAWGLRAQNAIYSSSFISSGISA